MMPEMLPLIHCILFFLKKMQNPSKAIMTASISDVCFWVVQTFRIQNISLSNYNRMSLLVVLDILNSIVSGLLYADCCKTLNIGRSVAHVAPDH